ncbi:hypothetical protein ZYGR_0AD01550 [Zygosaccharomyces rouxii]|uniref:Uncharacterized protein n=1 Tax=Zygosaccharomyces rouxii TaxID=4956 RepID=A0A1Q3A5J0_ZYGRO|nr:hypothetical protein LQ764DRAFT_25603 [Zygosaccharomyces rouxii]GAV50972.1 hypothetical protein ZYGR_0AD01550 [Zygosaccharomyces rouxii]
MKLYWILFPLLPLVHADQSCTTVPSKGTTETTPYSTGTTTITTDGRVEVAILEHYKAVVYVSSCGGPTTSSDSSLSPTSTPTTGSSTSSIGTTTVPVF